MLLGQFAEGSLFWYWYDAFVAAPVLVLAAIVSLRVLFRTSWTSVIMLAAKLVSLLGTLMVLLLVLDRMRMQTLDLEADAYVVLSIVGAAIAVIVGVLALLFSRIGKPRQGEKRGAEPRAAKDIPTREAPAAAAPAGATMVLSRVPKSPAWLVVRSGGVAGEIFEINQDRVTIGRGGESDYQLDDPSIGAPHVLIRVKEGRYLLYDMGSPSGTWVNGNSIAGAFLRDGSRISMGASELFFTKIDRGTQEGESADEGKMGVLLVRSGPSSGRSFPVGEQDLVIGREPGATGAQISDTAVSQRHALVRSTPHGILIYDLGSANGTNVDDVSLSGTLLNNGDVLKLGDAELQFVQEGF